MTDRKRVNTALKCCEDERPESCAACPYTSHDYPFCLSCLIKDVQALLNPVPRVLTISEIKSSDCEVLWMEFRTYGGVLQSMTPVCVERVGKCVICDEEMDVIEFTDGMDRVEDYGIRYRLWSARPTDDQRKEAGWQDGNVH